MKQLRFFMHTLVLLFLCSANQTNALKLPINEWSNKWFPHGEPTSISSTIAPHPLTATIELWVKDSFERDIQEFREQYLDLANSIKTELPKPTRFVFARSPVKLFNTKFTIGFRSYDRYLAEVMRTHTTLTKKWLDTPQNKRIFIIGAGSDLERVDKLTHFLKSKGYVTFFYKMCEEEGGEMCSSEAVGAFSATSHRTILVDTPNASASPYTGLEFANAIRLHAGDTPIIIVSPEEIGEAIIVRGIILRQQQQNQQRLEEPEVPFQTLPHRHLIDWP